MDAGHCPDDVHVACSAVHSRTHIVWTAAVRLTAAGAKEEYGGDGHVRARNLIRLSGFIPEYASGARIDGLNLVIDLGSSAAVHRVEDDRATNSLAIDLFPAPNVPGIGRQAGLKVSIFLEVEGAAHYLPAYAGNLDIMTSAALATAERIAATLCADALAT